MKLGFYGYIVSFLIGGLLAGLIISLAVYGRVSELAEDKNLIKYTDDSGYSFSYDPDSRSLEVSFGEGFRPGRIALDSSKFEAGVVYNFRVIKVIDDNAYINALPDGIGGYIVHDPGFSMATYKYNKISGEIKEIGDGLQRVVDISRDGELVYIDQRLIGIAKEDGTVAREFVVDDKWGQFGDAIISLGGDRIAYGASICNDECLSGAIIFIEVSSGNQSIYHEYSYEGPLSISLAQSPDGWWHDEVIALQVITNPNRSIFK